MRSLKKAEFDSSLTKVADHVSSGACTLPLEVLQAPRPWQDLQGNFEVWRLAVCIVKDPHPHIKYRVPRGHTAFASHCVS